MQNAGMDEAQAGIKIAGRNINSLRYADHTTLRADSKEPLEEGERGEWKSWLKTQPSKTKKIVASGPITSWQIDGQTMETVRDFIFLGSKITADGDCSHEIKRRLFLGRKALTNPDSILKSRDITLPAKVHIVQAMVFPVFMYGCESWTINKAEHRRIDAFEMWCWRRLLRVPWTARKNQPWIFIGRTDAETEAPILWLPVENWLTRKDPEAGKDWGKRRRDGRGWDGWMASATQWTWVWANSGRWWRTGKPGVLQSMVMTEWLNNNTY